MIDPKVEVTKLSEVRPVSVACRVGSGLICKADTARLQVFLDQAVKAGLFAIRDPIKGAQSCLSADDSPDPPKFVTLCLHLKLHSPNFCLVHLSSVSADSQVLFHSGGVVIREHFTAQGQRCQVQCLACEPSGWPTGPEYSAFHHSSGPI